MSIVDSREQKQSKSSRSRKGKSFVRRRRYIDHESNFRHQSSKTICRIQRAGASTGAHQRKNKQLNVTEWNKQFPNCKAIDETIKKNESQWLSFLIIIMK